MEEQETILIVDDNSTNLRVLVDYLRGCGYKTLVATSGERALTQLERNTPDLILLDVMMPGLDGFETCLRLKANPQTADIPVIFMTALSDTEHKVKGFTVGAVDYVTKPFQQEEVSARINAHLTIQRQKKQLADLNATKDKFFSVIGHDLRGPFTVLLGFSEIFADPKRDLTLQQRLRFGSLIHQSARNAYNLLENLLDWARLQRGVIEFEPVTLDIYTSIEECFSLVNHGALMKEIRLSHDVPRATYVNADPNMLNTIIRNLISNAIKFTSNGGAIDVHVTRKDEQLQVTVADTGVGISPADIEKLLSDMTSLSTTGTRGEQGTGLGLLLCREFITFHGGDLWIDSIEGEGSTFNFTLPLAPLPAGDGSDTPGSTGVPDPVM